jgi:D-alanyl-D-alanine carboxypeptidase/D-alanyl-D-alanine-endopeptidase (penicillin-binding protein 4)
MEKLIWIILGALVFVAAISPILAAAEPTSASSAQVTAVARPVPAAIQAIFDKPLYKGGTWGLRVVDLESGQVIYDVGPTKPMLTGSVRKLFTLAQALDKLGPDHRFVTPLYRTGQVKDGVLEGDLVLVASGDLAMGGRTLPDGNLAITDYDHNEANSIGNAVLTKPNPLGGYAKLAQQVAATGIREVAGDVVIDDRLFEPFEFRSEFKVRPIFVNDDLVDVILRPGVRFKDADVTWRPLSSAFGVENKLVTTPPGTQTIVDLEPEFPPCIGQPGCEGEVSGQLTENMKPPLTNKFPMIRTFRIVEPQNYARTVLIEELEKAGVKVRADAVAENPVAKLPPRDAYLDSVQVAELESPPYAQYAKWIMKVSYNIGADTSLVLVGLTRGVDTMAGALAAEKKSLPKEFGIPADEFSFFDGSGGGESAVTNGAIITLLRKVSDQSYFPSFFDALPVLGEDGSLAFVTDFMDEPTLAGARGQVYAKTGTYMTMADEQTLSLRSQSLAGYIDTKSGRRLAYVVVINDVPEIDGIEALLQVFQDEGTISAIVWREN